MKKTIALLLVVVMTLPLLACPAPTPPTPPTSDPYDAILSAYTALLEQKQAGEPLSSPADVDAETADALTRTVEACADPAKMGYATKDVDGDGSTELVLLNTDFKIYAAFTLYEGRPVLLIAEPDAAISINWEGEFYYDIAVPYQSSRHVKFIENGKLVGFEYGTYSVDGVWHSYWVNRGERKENLTEDEEYFMRQFLSSSLSIYAQDETRKAGFRYVPALAPTAESAAPLFDFSSYDAILTAYRRIVGSMKDATVGNFRTGAHDALFRFTDNESYAVFFSIYRNCRAFRPTTVYYGDEYMEGGDNAYGYAYRDLDGDGADELILLSDAYGIIAVFTEKDGRVEHLALSQEAWIDGDGNIYDPRIEVRTTEKRVYTLENGSFRLVVGYGGRIDYATQKNVRYRIQDGKRVSATGEELQALEDEWFGKQDGYSPAEYTKTHANITFRPLFEGASAADFSVGRYINPYYVNSGDLTLLSIEGDTVAFTVEWLYTDGIWGTEDYTSVVTTVEATATRDESGNYAFTYEGAKGYLSFGVDNIFVVITESESGTLPARARHYTVRRDN